MRLWIDRILLAAVTAAIVVLTATALPVLAGGHLEGLLLLGHMMASGLLVAALPLLALDFLVRNLSRFASGPWQRLGYWTLLLTGVVTIATIFACMLPIASTEQMHQLVGVHRYAGFAMVPAIVVLLVGVVRRAKAATRSSTPG
jgi:hypothetical protein